MCDCKSELESKLAQRHAEGNPSHSDVKASLDGYGFTLSGGTVKQRGLMPYVVRFAAPKKDGTAQRKTVKGSMMFSFCPFCGERWAEANSPAEASAGQGGGNV